MRKDNLHRPTRFVKAGLFPALLVFLIPSLQVLFAAGPSAATPSSPERIHRLIEALGDADYFVRQKAESDLGKIGFDAIEALTAATEHDDMEIATRANRLLYTIRSNWSVPGEPADVAQSLAGYDLQDDGSREDRVIRLIDLPENQGVPAVCRVIRYERSLSLAKMAALRLLEAMAGPDLPTMLEKREARDVPGSYRGAAKPDLAAIVQKGLGTCRRAPARWVLGWLQARHDPQALAGIWTQLAAEEEGLLFRQPRDTSLAVVETLLGFQIAALRKIDRVADAANSVERLIKLRRGQPDELARLLNWLIKQKDWPATRLVENRCRGTIDESANLLYLVGEAQLRRGDAAAAEQSASQALKLNADSDKRSLEKHFQAGESLEERGRFNWATKEWEHVIHDAPPQSPVGAAAARSLAELYHDLGEDGRAAETLGLIEKTYAKRSNQWPLLNPESGDAQALGTLRARMFYFNSCHWKVQGDRAKQRECLDKALATQFYDIEVLIECYQIPAQPAGFHEKICGLIEKRLCELREQVADLGSSIAAAEPCNEFAWLTANTEGDLDEALRLAKRSIDLVGEHGSYCDTLARVYYAKGDYANALKHQSRAAELLPFNRAVQKQLALFRKKAGEKEKKSEKSANGRGTG
ncbi:MAG: hypothetical protein ABSG53_28825 [Thermoguttaceae bacterium]